MGKHKDKSQKKRKASDESQAGNSPKRLPPVSDLIQGEEIPGWADKVFCEIFTHINGLKDDLQSSSDFSSHTATKALEESGVLKILFKEIFQRMNNMEHQVTQVKAENAMLRDKVNSLENHSRRDNLLFTGFREERGETDDVCKQKIYDLLRFKCCIPVDKLNTIKVVRCHRLGPFVQGKDRPIIIKFHYFPDKQLILSYGPSLKGSGIYMNEDYCRDTESKRRALYPVIKAARKLPEYKDKVHLQVDKILYNGKSYTVDTMGELPAPINPIRLSTPETENVVKFFGRTSPLSNFHESPITIDNVKYSRVEQFYQKEKAEMFGDEETAAAIMATSDPVKMYKLGQKVKDFDQGKWRQQSDSIMKRGLKAKFQIPKFRNFLLKTGDKEIAECNPNDPYWGTSVAMTDRRSDSPSTCPGQNRLGKLLQEVRSEYEQSLNRDTT